MTAPDIGYRLTAKAKASSAATSGSIISLNGTTVVDTYSDKLSLVSVSNASGTLSPGIDYTTAAAATGKNQMIYTIPGIPGSSDVREVSLDLAFELTPESYKDYMKSGGTYSKEFINEYYLSGGTPNEKLTEGIPVKTTMELSQYLQKDGNPTDASNKHYNWTLEVNSNFSQTSSAGVKVGGFIVDTIEGISSTHNYATNRGITINQGGTKNLQIEPASGDTSGLTYDSLTKATMAILNSLTSEGTKCVYFETQGDAAIMIIPINEYLLNPFSVTYQTDVKNTGNPEDARAQKLENKAKVVFDTIWYGHGSGIGSSSFDFDFDINVTKKTEANFLLLDKTAGKYTQANQEMTWQFAVNRFGEDLKSVTISDTLVDSKLRLPKTLLEGTGTIRVTKNAISTGQPTGGALSLSKKSDSTGQGPCYEITTGVGREGEATTILTLTLGDIPKTEFYSFEIDTLLVSAEILANQGLDIGTITNSSTLSAVIGNNTVNQKSTDQKDIPNTLIIKSQMEASSSDLHNPCPNTDNRCYNFNDKSLKWQITVNPNKLEIHNAVVEDLLPYGSAFGKMINVTRISADGASSAGIVSADSSTVSFGSLQVENSNEVVGNGENNSSTRGLQKFTFDETITDTFVFEFTTVFNSKYVKNIFVSDKDKAFVNDCELLGTVSSGGISRSIENATDNAIHTVKLAPMEKSGTSMNQNKNLTYTFADGTTASGLCWIDWKLLINRHGVDMGGTIVSDAFPASFELDKDAIRIYKATINAKGEASEGEEITSNLSVKEGIKTSFSGFTFTIPSQYKETPLLFKFNAILTNDTSARDMTNLAMWKNGDQEYSNTGTVTANNSFAYNVKDYASFMTLPYLTIEKISSITGAPLQGAEFLLTRMMHNGASWQEDSTYEKQKITMQNGNANYFFLKSNCLYKLVETRAPVDHVLSNDITYIFFGTPPTGSTGLPSDTYVAQRNKTLILKNTANNGMGSGGGNGSGNGSGGGGGSSVEPTPPVMPPVAPPAIQNPPILVPPTILPDGSVEIVSPPGTIIPGETEFDISGIGVNVRVTVNSEETLVLPPLAQGKYIIKNNSSGEEMTFTIGEEEIPLAGVDFSQPQTGVSETTYVFLLIMMLASLSAALVLMGKEVVRYRRNK